MLGVNTARSPTVKYGRVNDEQIEAIRRHFDTQPASRTRIVVTHHPFDLPDAPEPKARVGRAGAAMAAFAACGVDLLLAGHFHFSRSGDASGRYPLPGYSALAVQAGTATSTRGRGESTSFNVLRVQKVRISIERLAWQPGRGAFSGEGNRDLQARRVAPGRVLKPTFRRRFPGPGASAT